MTLQYNIVFGLLICEVFALVILLLLPSKPRKMLVQFTATSQLFQKLKVGAMVAFVVVAILFLDSLKKARDLRRDSTKGSGNPMGLTNPHVNYFSELFYAERNIYLTGFCLLLMLVLARFQKVLLDLARQEASVQALQSQIKNVERSNVELVGLANKKDVSERELKRAQANEQAIMKQADNVHQSYADLLQRYNDLEKKHASLLQEQRIRNGGHSPDEPAAADANSSESKKDK